ncbi:hypothetical protein PHSY_004629 [Pseudozyma hubeiensis SY62]|uniref:Uncharacterized protein n=1 Tax=Pseudozyma hubeiensis (strain SY62) TaxID=1305764 RepID=R9PG13_PSEHS|nr:hypothetical protein PHSY_004629 [Pseudozyma hubeiensis SY62]GAC97045.1 hypothetical protein PHSY_004629 [Pseudozyma hubeiensis SY62]
MGTETDGASARSLWVILSVLRRHVTLVQRRSHRKVAKNRSKRFRQLLSRHHRHPCITFQQHRRHLSEKQRIPFTVGSSAEQVRRDRPPPKASG